jgi:putative addiction module antidote
MHTLKLTQVGNSLGAIFPKDLLAKLNLGKGDEIYLTESPDGFRITKSGPEFEVQMAVAREVMKENRAVLRELA